MPWKQDGEKWHLGEKGFPPGKGVKWDRTLLPKLLKLLAEVAQTIVISWGTRDAITVRVPAISRFWVRVKTKEAATMEVWLVAKLGQFNAARFEGIGRAATVEGDRHEGLDLVTLTFVTVDEFDPKKLKPLLAEALKGFRETFAE